MRRAVRGLLGVAIGVCACSSDNTPDSGPGRRDAQPADAEETDGDLPQKDGSIFVVHDAGGPIPCNVTCDCPQGYACVDSECTSFGTPVYCCEKSGCPKGQQCLDMDDQPDLCDGDPDPMNRDGGLGPDTGPGMIGDHCNADLECDQTMGLSCWERFEPPGVWGYCTLPDCDFTPCPAATSCIQWTDGAGTPVATGCMEGCGFDSDCTTFSTCVPIPGLPTPGICVPRCQDDFFDCNPRDGSTFCDPVSGFWFPCDFTPSNNPSALIGDECLNSTQCAAGDICLGDYAWPFADGMCSHVCSGVPEASPCPIGSTCQLLTNTIPAPYNTIGLCFRDCVGGTCPNRIGSTCDTFDPDWIEPSCIPAP